MLSCCLPDGRCGFTTIHKRLEPTAFLWICFSIFRGCSSLDPADVKTVVTRSWSCACSCVCMCVGTGVKYRFNLVLITQSLQAGWQHWWNQQLPCELSFPLIWFKAQMPPMPTCCYGNNAKYKHNKENLDSLTAYVLVPSFFLCILHACQLDRGDLRRVSGVCRPMMTV